ncbi:hypothetical protein BDV12DRAFT_171833 [Aspergillus spectabilis]
MDYPTSTSSDKSDDDYPFPDDNDIPEQDDFWGKNIARENSRNGSIDKPFKRARVRGPDDTALDKYPQNTNPVTSEANNTNSLLLQVLEIFPDISHKYVKDLIARHRASLLATTDFYPNNVEIALSAEAIYEEILGQTTYPKEEPEKGKRKREGPEDDKNDWEDNTLHQSQPYVYSEAAAAILANEFLYMPMQHIRKVLREKGRLHPTFLALHSDANHLFEKARRSYVKLKKTRVATPPKNNDVLGDILTRELSAARKHTEKLQSALNKKKEEEEAERANEELHTRTGNLIECQCCYIDAPANRCIPCEGADLHFFCFSCIRRSAETQIGLMKYTVQCFDVSGCQASFARPQLREILGSLTMEKLDSLQQEDEIRKAALDGLEDCPFCSFKAILPPVEEDKEFRCENPECKLVSCRLCKEESHIPMTCEEARKDKGLSERHEVEEAMSKALIRSCPRCQVKIVKDYGCNKMVCSKCGAFMCYICQKDITKEGYDHFGAGKCVQDDSRNHDQRQVQNAQKAAIQGILARNPDITEEQLKVDLPKTKAARANQPHHPLLNGRPAQNPMLGDLMHGLQYPHAPPPNWPVYPIHPRPVPYYAQYVVPEPQPQRHPPVAERAFPRVRVQPANLPAQPARGGVRVEGPQTQQQQRNPAQLLHDFQTMNGDPVVPQPPQQWPGRFGGQRLHGHPDAFFHAMYADVLDGNNRYGGDIYGNDRHGNEWYGNNRLGNDMYGGDRQYGNDAGGYPEA